MKKIVLSLVAFISLTFNSIFAGQIFYVKTDGNDANDGKSWAGAFKDVQKAIDSAALVATEAEPAQVWIAAGEYKNAGGKYNSSTGENTAFVMKNNVAIFGGFAGTETSLDERKFENETILTTAGSYVIYNAYTADAPLTNSAKLDSVTIFNDYRGMYNIYASPNVNNCKVTGNKVGISNENSSPIITNSTITGQSGNGATGISCSDNSNADLDYCVISNNSHAISIAGSSNVTISNCLINNNTSDGISSSRSIVKITNCTIVDNRAKGISLGVNSDGSTITNCTILRNRTGGIYSNVGDVTITNSILWRNSSSQLSIYVDYPKVSNCIIEGYTPYGENIINEDPMLGELDYYGGSIKSIPVLANSPAIGAGLNAEAVPSLDVRGLVRKSPCTIGAFEASNSKPSYVHIKANAKAFLNGNKYEISVDADGAPIGYILYKNGVEIMRSNSNKFLVKVDELGYARYRAGVLYNGEEIKTSELKINHLVPKVFYVSKSGSDDNYGTSWEDAFFELDTALSYAVSAARDDAPVQIWVAAGTYEVPSGFELREMVELYGGFAGTETMLEQRVKDNVTILNKRSISGVNLSNSAKFDGFELSDINITLTNACPVISNCKIVSGGIKNEIASDSLIINCEIIGSSNGIYNTNSSPTIKNCTISECSSNAIYNDDSAPIIDSCVFSKNATGLVEKNSNSIIKNTYIIDSTSEANNAGAIQATNPNTILENCTISGNSGSQGIYISGAQGGMVLNNCSISYNVGDGIDTYGAESLPILNNCTISGNGGSGVASNAILNNCTITDNALAGVACRGGRAVLSINGCTVLRNGTNGVESYSINSVITNCTISGNLENGILNKVCSPTITNCTVTKNGKYGIYNYDGNDEINGDNPNNITSSSCKPVITNCIVWDNPAMQIANGRGANPTIAYCVVEGGYAYSDTIISADPLLGELGNYGGSVDTIPIPKGSSAIAAGISGENIPTVDARGVARYSSPTIGAYEYDFSPNFAFTTQPKSAEITEGDDVSFIVSTNEAGVNYQWYKNGEILEGETSSNLTLKNVVLDDNGSEFYCVVSKYVTSFTSDVATLTVKKEQGALTDPFGEPITNNKLHMTILADIDYFGFLAEAGYVVAAFVGDELRGKSTVQINAGKPYVNLAVTVKNDGEEIRFKIWNHLENEVYDASPNCVVSAVSGGNCGSPTDFYTIVFAESLDLNLALKTGWNQISFNVEMDDVSILSVFSSIIDNVEVIQAMSSSFYPDWGDFNSLKNFDNVSGFWVKVTSGTNICVSGPDLDVTKHSITLKEGWNNIGYTPASAQKTSEVLATALATGNIEMIINDYGNFDISVPEVLNSLTSLTPGQGYWVKAKKTFSFTYDNVANTSKATTFMSAGGSLKLRSLSLAVNLTDPFGEPVTGDNNNIPMLIHTDVTWNGGLLPAGSVVAAFVGNELRAKATVITEIANKTIANLTVQVKVDNEELKFKVWNAQTDELYEVPNVTILTDKDGEISYKYPTNPVVLNVVTTKSGFDSWVEKSGLTGDNAKPKAKPFDDGITNLEKFAFGLDATKSTSYSENPNFKQTTDGTTVTFEYPLNKEAEYLTVTALVSIDLKTWIKATATLVGEDGNFNLYKVERTIPTGGKLFFKLDVSE